MKSWDRGSGSTKFQFFHSNFRKFRFFSGNFTQKLDFFQANFQNISLFHAISPKISIFRQKLVIYSYFWTNYSISLQKSPLSNIEYFLYTIRYNNISRPVPDPHGPLPKIWGVATPNPPRIDAPDVRRGDVDHGQRFSIRQHRSCQDPGVVRVPSLPSLCCGTHEQLRIIFVYLDYLSLCLVL